MRHVCEGPRLEIGTKVQKISGKPFKSGQKIATVTGIEPHPQAASKPFLAIHDCYTFIEDDSRVECRRCIRAESGSSTLPETAED